jgi:uncharacterized protein (DUF1800 family)
MMRRTHGFPQLALVAAATAIVTVLSPFVQAQRSTVPSRPDDRTIAHVLDRLGFGARPGDMQRVRQMGLASYIEQQLHPERIADGAVASRLSEFQTLSMSTAALSADYFEPADRLRRQQQQQQARAAAADPAMAGGATMTTPPPPRTPPGPEQRMLQQRQQSVTAELMQAKLLRAALSERQLEEVLVDFWFNHFNVFVNKGQVRQYLTAYERDVIRPNVLGNFRTLLGATAHSPAMLFYLDNFQSRAAAPPAALPGNLQRRRNDPRLPPNQRQQLQQRLDQMQQRRPQGGLNENYARELMELHTLGVDGGYTQQDVVEVARILTGWTIDRPQQGGSFVFRPQTHDTGKKTVLGTTFSSAGEKEGERLLDMLASHPSTAKHIARKLAQRFVADEPPAALVDRAAKKFLDTKGDLREVTRLIITSPEFFDEHYFAAKVKTPLEFVVSAVRATNANIVNAQPMVAALRDLGMPLYGAQPPTGYSMTADAWVNTGALLSRMNFAGLLVGLPQRPGPGTADQMGPGGQAGRGRQAGQGARAGQPPARPGLRGQGRGQQAAAARGALQVDVRSIAPDTTGASVDRAIEMLLGGRASDATRQTIARAETPQQLVALTLGSPEFQRR